MKLLTRIWLRILLPLKIWYSRLFKRIKFPVKREIDSMNILKIHPDTINYSCETGLYRHDTIFKVIPFDWQMDWVTCMVEGGDCNSLHRIPQVYFHCLGFESYLITIITKPIKKSHALVVYKKPVGNSLIWTMWNYKVELQLDTSFNIAIAKLQKWYAENNNVKILAVGIQDINFKTKEVI